MAPGCHNDPLSHLKDRLRTDLTAAIKARNEVRSSTIRMVLTAVTNAEVAGKSSRELTDEDVVEVLSSEAKKRREAAEAFENAGRAEMAAKERAEAAVLADYLPTPLTEQEIVDDQDVTVTVQVHSKRELVLTTCHPRFSAAQRLVVYSELVERIE